MRQLIMWLVIEKPDQEKKKYIAFSFAFYPLLGIPGTYGNGVG